jgi:hypothetical protein
MKIKGLGLVFILMISLNLSAQSLFEEAEKGEDRDKAFELTGYLRSALYLGKMPDRDPADMKSGYGEFSLKLKASKASFGSAFAEVRFRRGYEFNDYLSEVNLREAYVSAYIGPFDFRIGHQIVAWGRADGINPTDNITPKNMLARSPDEDDRREANFLLRTFFNAHPVRIELIWVPLFRSSVVPTHLISFPPGITLGDPDYPDARLKNGAVAAKLNLELASFDCSLSYFNGFNPFSGVNAELSAQGMTIFLKPYRLHVFGADFSTTLAGFGLRGEMAYKDPQENYSFSYIPNPELHYVIGLDKEFSGNLSVILQYIGRYVLDYSPLALPPVPSLIPAYELELKNRIISSQQYETSHSFSCRLGWNLLHETLNLEFVGLANFTTEEFLFRPKMAYDITDALTFTLGGELYAGPNDTLFDFIEDHLSSLFAELRISF